MAIGTITETVVGDIGNIRVIKFACVAASLDGSFPSHVVESNFEGTVLELETKPGTPAPASYGITIKDANGIDILQTLGGSRSATVAECVPIVRTTNYKHPIVDDSDVLTLAITGSTKNSAVTAIYLKYALGVIS